MGFGGVSICGCEPGPGSVPVAQAWGQYVAVGSHPWNLWLACVGGLSGSDIEDFKVLVPGYYVTFGTPWRHGCHPPSTRAFLGFPKFKETLGLSSAVVVS